MNGRGLSRIISFVLICSLILPLVYFGTSGEVSAFDASDYISVRSFGATGNPTDDDTDAIKAAVAEAKRTGKTLFFPAGLYKVSKSVNIPAGVDIEGVTSATNGPWQNLYDGESKGFKYNDKSSSNFFDPDMNLGTWILATNGSTNVDAGATFQLSGDNTIKNIGFINLFSPPLYTAGITETPPVIGVNINELTSTKGIIIEDISLSNPYYGIAVYQGSLKNYNTSSSLSGKNSGPITIRNIMGAAMYRGISVIGANGKVTIENIQFNYATYEKQYITQHWNNCVDIDIAASADVTITNVLSFGAHTGLQTSSAFKGSSVNLTASNINLEGEKPLILTASGRQTVSNGYLLLNNFADLSAKKDWVALTIHQDKSSTVKPVYTIKNLVFQDSIGDIANPDIQIDISVSTGATIDMTNITMWNWNPGTNEPLIKYVHDSGTASSCVITNLALCTSGQGLLATVSGSQYKTGELTFKYGRFPTSVLASMNTSSGAPVKFISCTKNNNQSNTLFSN